MGHVITIDDDPAILLMRGRRKANVICSCGHSEARHIQLPGRETQMCDGARGTCKCRTMELVLEADDARVFMYGSLGKIHPLVAGMLSLKAKGKSWTWKPGKGTCQYRVMGSDSDCGAPMKTAVFSIDRTRTQLRCEEHAE